MRRINGNDMGHEMDDFKKMQRNLFKNFGCFAIIALTVSLGFFAGLIYFVFWCLNHFGVIS